MPMESPLTHVLAQAPETVLSGTGSGATKTCNNELLIYEMNYEPEIKCS